MAVTTTMSQLPLIAKGSVIWFASHSPPAQIRICTAATVQIGRNACWGVRRLCSHVNAAIRAAIRIRWAAPPA